MKIKLLPTENFTVWAYSWKEKFINYLTVAIQCFLLRPVLGGSTKSSPTPLHFLPQTSLPDIGLNLDFWRSLCPSSGTWKLISPKTYSRALWEEKLLLLQPFSWSVQFSIDHESSSPGMWVGCPSATLQEDYGSLGPSSDSFWEKLPSVLEGENQNLSNFLSCIFSESH